eukprot:2957346-Amphidinium_carterae.1
MMHTRHNEDILQSLILDWVAVYHAPVTLSCTVFPGAWCSEMALWVHWSYIGSMRTSTTSDLLRVGAKETHHLTCASAELDRLRHELFVQIVLVRLRMHERQTEQVSGHGGWEIDHDDVFLAIRYDARIALAEPMLALLQRSKEAGTMHQTFPWNLLPPTQLHIPLSKTLYFGPKYIWVLSASVGGCPLRAVCARVVCRKNFAAEPGASTHAGSFAMLRRAYGGYLLRPFPPMCYCRCLKRSVDTLVEYFTASRMKRVLTAPFQNLLQLTEYCNQLEANSSHSRGEELSGQHRVAIAGKHCLPCHGCCSSPLAFSLWLALSPSAPVLVRPPSVTSR